MALQLTWDSNGVGTFTGSGGNEVADISSANKLSAFAATSSLELKGVISDETGSGALAFATSPALVTPTITSPVITGAATSIASPIIPAVAVAALPASPVEGQRASVNNSNAATFFDGLGLVVVGGGTTHCPVYYDGTNWRIG